MQNNCLKHIDVIEYTRHSAKNFTPFRLTPTAEKILHLYSKDNKEVDLAYLPAETEIAEAVGKSRSSVVRAFKLLAKYKIVIIHKVDTKFGKVNDYEFTEKLKEYNEEAREQERLAKTKKAIKQIQSCGTVDLFWSTDHPEENDHFFDTFVAKCNTNINTNVLKNNINLINTNSEKQKAEEETSKTTAENKQPVKKCTKTLNKHFVKPVVKNEYNVQYVDYDRSDNNQCPVIRVTAQFQYNNISPHRRDFVGKSSSDERSENANLDSKTNLPEVPLTENFQLSDASYKFAQEVKRLAHDDILMSLVSFTSHFTNDKDAKSRNWQKAYCSWLKNYNPYLDTSKKPKQFVQERPRANETEYGSHNPYITQSDTSSGSWDKKTIEICSPKSGLSWRERQRLYEMARRG